jgi:hypothetical protein
MSMDSRLHRRALSLSYFTVGYNISEGVVSILAGALSIGLGLNYLYGFWQADPMVGRLGVLPLQFKPYCVIHNEVSEKLEKRALSANQRFFR